MARDIGTGSRAGARYHRVRKVMSLRSAALRCKGTLTPSFTAKDPRTDIKYRRKALRIPRCNPPLVICPRIRRATSLSRRVRLSLWLRGSCRTTARPRVSIGQISFWRRRTGTRTRRRPRIGDVVWMHEQSFPLIVRAQSSEATSPNACRQRPEHRALAGHE